MAPAQKGAAREGATLVFVDEAGFSERPSVRRTWAKRGQTPVLKAPFNWQRLSAVGVLVHSPRTQRTRLLLSLRTGSITSAQSIQTLRDLRRHVRGKVVLLWDGLAGHWSKETRRHIESQRSWLQVERLPAYAPELNPVEGVWANLKAKELANLCPNGLGELAAEVHRGVARIEKHAALNHGFLKHSGLFPELSS